MNADELRELGRRAVTRANNHGQGWRLTWEARRLIRAGDSGARIAIDALWELWLCDPDERWWTALRRWRRPADPGSRLNSVIHGAEDLHHLSLAALDDPAVGWSPRGLARAAGLARHPIAAIARQRILNPGAGLSIDDVCLAATGDPSALAFLDDYEIRPARESTLAAFLLLRGEQAAYWELDPGQALLARAYRELPDLRGRLRAAIPRFGDLDPVRVLTTALDGEPWSPGEVGYVSARISADRDPDRLWRFARDLPPADAALALQDADPRWRPTDGAELYTLLRSVGDQLLRERIGVLAAARTLPVDGPVRYGAFSADDRFLAVVIESTLWVFDLDTGAPPEKHAIRGAVPGPVSFEGHRPLVCQSWPDERSARSTVWRIGPGRRAGRALPGWANQLRPVSTDGTTQAALLSRNPIQPSPEVMLIRRRGPAAYWPTAILPPPGMPSQTTTPPCLSDQTATPPRMPDRTTTPPRLPDRTTTPPRLPDRVVEESIGWLLDTDPELGRVAIARRRIMVAEPARGNRLRGLAVSPRLDHEPRALCLGGPGQLFTAAYDGVTRWRADGTVLKPVVTVELTVDRLAWVPYRNAVLVDYHRNGIGYLDADTLQPLDQSFDLNGVRSAREPFAAPSGSHAAASDRWIHVALASAAALTDLARRPLAGATAADHDVLAAARQRRALREQAGMLLDVLEANHHYRTGQPPAVADDR